MIICFSLWLKKVYFKNMRLFSLILLIAGMYVPEFALAQDRPHPDFALPIKCTYGVDCWITNYTDTGPSGDEKALDLACGTRTYEGHKGTDFDIADERAMKNGVAVLAAQSGRILRARDGETDQWASAAQLAQIRKDQKDCGNAVLIDHENGWQSMYCHLKNGSVSVKARQKVIKGQKIGEVGLSGYTKYPHLHFGITYKDIIMDPFTGASIEESCGKKMSPLWDRNFKIPYEHLAVQKTGFDNKAPSLRLFDLGEKPKEKLYSNLTPSLVYYLLYNGARAGDIIDLKIFGPDGKVFAEHKTTQDKSRERQLEFVGRKTDQVLLRKGNYKGVATITRKNADGTALRWSKENILVVE
jgi:murein DD-endopeptidase